MLKRQLQWKFALVYGEQLRKFIYEHVFGSWNINNYHTKQEQILAHIDYKIFDVESIKIKNDIKF